MASWFIGINNVPVRVACLFLFSVLNSHLLILKFWRKKISNFQDGGRWNAIVSGVHGQVGQCPFRCRFMQGLRSVLQKGKTFALSVSWPNQWVPSSVVLYLWKRFVVDTPLSFTIYSIGVMTTSSVFEKKVSKGTADFRNGSFSLVFNP